MAGLGAPEVSQCRMTDMLSITALSAGPAVMLGAIPERGGGAGSDAHTETDANKISKNRGDDSKRKHIPPLIKQMAAVSLIDLTKGAAVRSHSPGQLGGY